MTEPIAQAFSSHEKPIGTVARIIGWIGGLTLIATFVVQLNGIRSSLNHIDRELPFIREALMLREPPDQVPTHAAADAADPEMTPGEFRRPDAQGFETAELSQHVASLGVAISNLTRILPALGTPAAVAPNEEHLAKFLESFRKREEETAASQESLAQDINRMRIELGITDEFEKQLLSTPAPPEQYRPLVNAIKRWTETDRIMSGLRIRMAQEVQDAGRN